jgi:hypothetical protein
VRGRLLAIALAALGALVGVMLTLAAGTVCVVGTHVGFCELHFLGWNVSRFAGITLSATLGAGVGGLLGLASALTSWAR